MPTIAATELPEAGSAAPLSADLDASVTKTVTGRSIRAATYSVVVKGGSQC